MKALKMKLFGLSERAISHYNQLRRFYSFALRLWELIDLALPVFILVIAQVVLMYVYLNLVTFKAMGSDYDAAVMVSGHCGFGLGATPNGISNMKAVTEKYVYSKMALFVIPIVGSLFIDFVNISIITVFTQFFK